MAWLQYRLDTTADAAGTAEQALLDLGAAAVTLQDNADQPLFDLGQEKKQLWHETRVTGLFPADTDIDRLWQALPAQVRDYCQPRAELLEDKDWEREWMQHYSPQQYADNLWICPSWMEPPDPAATTIMLDPGLAFGTGTHPTTAMCLQLLAELDLAGKRVTDFGCGSGILGIGALLLGASEVLGVDTDPQALVATRANCERNAISPERCPVKHPRELHGSESADVVIANILAGPLMGLADILCEQLQGGGTLILSGILAEQVPELTAAYPLPLSVARQRDEWVALVGQVL